MAAYSDVYMTVVTLAATTPGINCCPDSAMVHDVIWALAACGRCLEHIRVSAAGDQIKVVVFVMAATAEDAHCAAVVACDRACRDSPLLKGWMVRR